MTTIRPMNQGSNNPAPKTDKPAPVSPQPTDYIPIEQYLMKGTMTPIKSIKFYGPDNSELEISIHLIEWRRKDHPQILLTPAVSKIYADRENKIIYVKDIDGPPEEPTITFPYHTNETIFET